MQCVWGMRSFLFSAHRSNHFLGVDRRRFLRPFLDAVIVVVVDRPTFDCASVMACGGCFDCAVANGAAGVDDDDDDGVVVNVADVCD